MIGVRGLRRSLLFESRLQSYQRRLPFQRRRRHCAAHYSRTNGAAERHAKTHVAYSIHGAAKRKVVARYLASISTCASELPQGNPTKIEQAEGPMKLALFKWARCAQSE